jgi:ribulose-5-phosphate 4-epimerase/fuculose-1-phosphate aldolase
VTEEQSLKRDLVLACRILAAQGQGDAIFGHMSARLPGWDSFWMKPTGIGLEEVCEDDLILLDFEGQVLAGHRPRHEEYPIHAEIMRARSDVLAVVHTHPRKSIALAARGLELRPVSHEGSYFWPPGVPTFDAFTDLVRTREQGEAVARALGNRRAIFLRNHGIAVPGTSVAEACCAAIMLERAAEIQLLVQPSAEATILHTPEEEAQAKQAIWYPERLRTIFEYFARKVVGTPTGNHAEHQTA